MSMRENRDGKRISLTHAGAHNAAGELRCRIGYLVLRQMLGKRVSVGMVLEQSEINYKIKINYFQLTDS